MGEGANHGPGGHRDEDTLTHVSRGRGDQDTSESLDLVVALQVEKGAHTWATLKWMGFRGQLVRAGGSIWGTLTYSWVGVL